MVFAVRQIARFVSGRLLPRAAYPVIRGPLRGARFFLGALAGEGGGSSVYFNLLEKEQTAMLVSLLGAGQTFMDIGANAGLYTILGSRLVGSGGKVIAIEPVMRNLFFLYKHVKINRALNVDIFTGACSDVVSLASFHGGDNYALGHLASGASQTEGLSERKTLVPTVTVDTICQSLGLYPDVIKIDVEGAELSVLMGAVKTLGCSSPHILLSTHSQELQRQCLAFLQNSGYIIERLSRENQDSMEFLARKRER